MITKEKLVDIMRNELEWDGWPDGSGSIVKMEEAASAILSAIEAEQVVLADGEFAYLNVSFKYTGMSVDSNRSLRTLPSKSGKVVFIPKEGR